MSIMLTFFFALRDQLSCYVSITPVAQFLTSVIRANAHQKCLTFNNRIKHVSKRKTIGR
jgi:hypothetical protein